VVNLRGKRVGISRRDAEDAEEIRTQKTQMNTAEQDEFRFSEGKADQLFENMHLWESAFIQVYLRARNLNFSFASPRLCVSARELSEV
jgi:hypothetical protein